MTSKQFAGFCIFMFAIILVIIFFTDANQGREIEALESQVESLEKQLETERNIRLNDAVYQAILEGYKLDVMSPATINHMWSKKAYQDVIQEKSMLRYAYKQAAVKYDWDKYGVYHYKFLQEEDSEHAIWNIAKHFKISKLAARGIFLQLVYWRERSQLGRVSDDFLRK